MFLSLLLLFGRRPALHCPRLKGRKPKFVRGKKNPSSIYTQVSGVAHVLFTDYERYAAYGRNTLNLYTIPLTVAQNNNNKNNLWSGGEKKSRNKIKQPTRTRRYDTTNVPREFQAEFPLWRIYRVRDSTRQQKRIDNPNEFLITTGFSAYVQEINMGRIRRLWLVNAANKT